MIPHPDSRASSRTVVILHNAVSDASSPDERDVLDQAEAIECALGELGFRTVRIGLGLDLTAAVSALRDKAPLFAVNLVESLDARGCLIHVGPALLTAMRIPYTGGPLDAIFNTSNKLTGKRILALAGLPTPDWIEAEGIAARHVEPGRYIIKSVWEHASVGLDDTSIVTGDIASIRQDMASRRDRLGGLCFAERFIDGREFNIGMLTTGGVPEVLPPAEIDFVGYDDGKPKMVGYQAKWDESSFEYHNTVRKYAFAETDGRLLEELADLSRACWDLFHLKGYARVDFRIDSDGKPWILEINANPCLSKDAGFAAALQRAGISYTEAIRRIVSDLNV